MKTAVYLLGDHARTLIYGPDQQARIAAQVRVLSPDCLAEAEIVISGWGMPCVDAAFLARAPKLAAIFYGAGSVRGFVTEALWERGVVVSSAAAMNAIPVAEFTLGQILLALKHVFRHAQILREHGQAAWRQARAAVPGGYRSRVGLIALGEIGRRVAEHLRPFDLEVLAYDPFAPEALFASLRVTRVHTLDELVAMCDVVSVHAPNLPENRQMLRREHFAAMKLGATLINTARGDLLCESDLVSVLAERPDLWACLDVLASGDSADDPRLFALPNITLTPHIAGSLDTECQRMGDFAADELGRYLAGQPLLGEVTPDRLARMA